MKRSLVFLLLFLVMQHALPQSSYIDMVQFGNAENEKNHGFTAVLTEVMKGGMNEPARKMLPRNPVSFDGGTMAFQMKVDPQKQNYFTVRCWGSESDNSYVMLFIEGKQVGYRHLSDLDLLHRGNGEPPFFNRFYYYTIPLPIKYTKSKSLVNLELRSYGESWDYGTTFETFQKNLTKPTIGFYSSYTHTETCFVPDKKEVQGKYPVTASIRTAPGPQVLDSLKTRVNSDLRKILNLYRPLNQLELWFLADAYHVQWTNAYNNPDVTRKVMHSIDEFYKDYLGNPKLLYTDKNMYNADWIAAGPIACSIRGLWKQISPLIDQQFDNGKGDSISHRKAWSELMRANLVYSTTHRRQYSNQSMILDLFLYHCNRALMLMDPDKALPEQETLHYLYESLSLAPWLGSQTKNGPEKPMGDNYYQLTRQGLTKELGFVGYYGEVLDWVVNIYKATEMPGVPDSGDEKIRQQVLKMAKARSYFRYPSLDDGGNKAMRAEAVIGWRDGVHYPGSITYGDRGIAWDASPVMTAAATLDPEAVGVAQQMFDDNQFFNVVSEKMKMEGLPVTKSLLEIPDQYELLKKQPKSATQLPMSKSMPDFVFSDEDDGVVALKNGDEILYASLYWRARTGINNVAKVHYMTPENDRIANICIESQFEPSGLFFTRRNWVTLSWLPIRNFYPGIESAHVGEVLPIAKVPGGIEFKPGEENPYAGKAEFYKMKYGKYLVAMNCTDDKSYDLEVPAGYSNATDLVTKKKIGNVKLLHIKPRTTVVLVPEK